MTASVPDRPQLGPCVNPDCDADDGCCCPGDRGFVAAPSRDGGPVDDEVVKRLRVAARVAFPGPDDTDASYLLGAARKLESGYEAGGSNVKAAIARVLRVVAEAVRDV